MGEDRHGHEHSLAAPCDDATSPRDVAPASVAGPAEPTLRVAGPADAAGLSALGWETFLDTFVRGFAIPYPPADLDAFFAASYAPARFADLLADVRRRAWLVERGGKAVGFAVAGPCTLPHPDVRPGDGELQRLYVSPGEKGTGLAPRLMDAATAWLQRDGPRPIWLGVWSGNLRAQRFYARRGFRKVGEYDYPVGETRDHEFILRRP